ncbi:MAG: SsgA family sporulation/cell division regulator [Pedococcus sp.]
MASPAIPGCSTRATLQLVGPTSWTEVSASFRYDAGDPFAVRIRFGGRPGADDDRDAGDGVEWLVARDLLRAGLGHPSGHGDIRLWPARTSGDVLFLELRAPSGNALFELSRALLAGFLADTDRLVPCGDESDAVDIEPELVALLRCERPDADGR